MLALSHKKTCACDAANIAQHTFPPASFQGERWPEIASDWNICRRMKHSDSQFWF